MDAPDLERLIDRELRALPGPRAPRTLLPRVMAAIADEARRPWYARAWFQWPAGWQVASALVLLGVVAVGSVMLPQARDAALALRVVGELRGGVAESARDVEAAASAARVVWRALLAPVVPWAFALLTLMCAACAVFGTALNHLVFGKAWR